MSSSSSNRWKSTQNDTNDDDTVDWLELPSELLIQIAENLRSVEDYVAFSCVCRCWHNAISGSDMNKLRYNWAHHQMPWLLLTDGNQKILDTSSHNWVQRFQDPWVLVIGDDIEEILETKDEVLLLLLNDEEELMMDNNGKSYKRSMLNLNNGNTYTVNCPQGYRRNCWGSSHGWIFAQDNTPNLCVFNPVTNTRLDLPSKTTLPLRLELVNSYAITTAAIFNRVLPSDDDDVPGGRAEAEGDPTSLFVVLIYNFYTTIVFAKPGDTEWTVIGYTSPGEHLLDVSYGNGRLIVLGEMGAIGYCDLERSHQQQQQDLDEPLGLTWYDCNLELLRNQQSLGIDKPFLLSDYTTYLAHCGEDLLLVVRMFLIDKNTRNVNYANENYWTFKFRVYKFLIGDEQWEELEDLGDVALFVGSNTTMSVCASDVGCQPNSIYFTDDSKESYTLTEDRLGGADMGIFRMADQSILPLDLNNNNTHTRSYYCCPLWFIPTL